MKCIIILCFSLIVASAAIEQIEGGYGRIDEYLVKNVNNDDVDSNMKAASDWLNEQSGKVTSLIIPSSDLKSFVALQQVIDDTKCDHTAYEIMRTNEAAIGLHKLIDDGKVLPRVGKVMLKIFKTHAENCQQVYPSTYMTKKEQLDEVVAGHVEGLSNTIMEANRIVPGRRVSQYELNSKNLFHKYVKNYLTVKSFANHNVLQNALVLNSREDPNSKYARGILDKSLGKRVVHTDKMKELTRKYMIEPCNQFVALMGPDLFIPARFDAQVYPKIDDNNQEYYKSWSQFVICKALTSNEKAVYDEIIKSAKDQQLLE